MAQQDNVTHLRPRVHAAGVGSESAPAPPETAAEEALRASEERFRIFMDNSPAITMMKDEDGHYVYVSARWLEYYGRREEDVLGRTPHELFPPDVADHYRRHEQEVLASDRTILSVEPRQRKDGSRGWGLAYKFPVVEPSGRRLVGGVGIDITEWKQAEGELREAETKYRTLVEQLPVVTYVDNLDDLSSNVYTSPQVEPMLGYPVEQWRDDPQLFVKILHDDDRERVLAEHERTRATGEPLSTEYRLIARDGRTVWCRDEARVIGDTDGRPRCLQGYLVDVTEQKLADEAHERLETELRHAQKMEALGRLAGGVAHDFNNLLTAIAGYGEVILGDLRPDDPLRSAAEEIKRAADRAGLLTRQLLTFSRRQLVQRRVLDLNEVVGSTAPMLARLIGEDVEFTTTLRPEELPVEIDPGQLEQVIVNLVVNARDALPNGGRIAIHTDRLDVGGTTRASLAPGRYATLAVSDDGEGMDPETRHRIFEPFFTTKDVGSGTGLGLSIVYAIVQESGGRVEVETAPGSGSTFSIVLPWADPRGRAEDPAEEAPDVSRGSGTILLAEDDDVVRGLIARTLRQHGYEVLEARDGQDALELAEACGDVELVVTDLVMPRLSGYELAERLLVKRPSTSMVFMSGYAGERSPSTRPIPSGATLLEKPFTPSMLLRCVDSALRERTA